MKNKKSVSYFYPGTTTKKSKSIHHNASVVQGGLEQLSFDRKIWKGHYGDLSGAKARVKLSSKQKNEGSPMDIDFIDESTAKISFECNAPVLMCNSLKEFQDRELRKIY